MTSPVVDIQSRFINALRTQASHKAEQRLQACPSPCPYGHRDRISQTAEQLLAHTKSEHVSDRVGLEEGQARHEVRDEAIKYW
jgi:hypothetical protein